MKTVRVRIAVAVDSEGNWDTHGLNCGIPHCDAFLARVASQKLNGARVSFIEADVPLPEEITAEGKVVT